MTNSTTAPIINSTKSSSISYVHVEQPGVRITLVEFNGNNYDEWSRSFHLALMAKGKVGYIDGTITKPATTADEFEGWQSTNALVTAWMLNTIETTVKRQISIRPEARLVWNDIKNRFCQSNEARIYQLESELLACRQGPTESLMAYYGRMSTLWDEIMEHDPLPRCSCASCPCDWATIIANRREKKKVRGFLIGLDERFSHTRSHIIGLNPLPRLDVIYNRLLQDEGVRNLTLSKPDQNHDAMAFATHVSNGGRNSGGGRDSRSDRRNNNAPSKYFCDACQKSGHSLQYCHKVTGKFPEWWGDRPRDRIYLDPNFPNDLSKATIVPDPRGVLSDRNTRRGSGAPKANMASVNSATAGYASTSRPPMQHLDTIDFNSLTPQELEEVTCMWNARKSETSTDRLNGPYLEDGDWCG